MSEQPAAPAQRTDPLGMIVGAADGLRQAVLPAVAGLFALRDEMPPAAVGTLFVVLLLGIGSLSAFLRWWRTTYTVGAEDIRLEQGLIARSARSVPFDRIQDVSLEAKLLARFFGLVAVRLETGGGGSDEIALTWLSEAEGERLRKLVRERRDETAAAPVDQPQADDRGVTVFAMAPRRLFVFGLFEFSLAVVAVLAGAAQQFEAVLPFDLWDLDEWESRLAGPGARLAGLGRGAQAIGAAIAILALVGVGVVTGLAKTVARDWGFRLDRTPRGFRRRRGLFTRTDTVMPADRVQALQVRTGLVRRRFGWHALKFVSLAQDAGSGSHVVAPFAQMSEIASIARDAGFPLPGDDVAWRRPSSRAHLDRALIGASLAIVGSAGLLFSVVPALAPVPLAIAALLAVRQAFLWRQDGHALDGRQIYRRRGWLAPRLDVARRAKLQSAEIRQGPLGRRRGYADLHLGLAGGKLHFGGLPLARARELRAAVLASMAATDFAGAAGSRPAFPQDEEEEQNRAAGNLTPINGL